MMDKKLLSEDVLNKLDTDMQIHTFDERNHLMDWLMANKLGEKTGLYKDEMVSRDCTPNYLPEFIAIEVNKRNKN